jgi:hypothetical protein
VVLLYAGRTLERFEETAHAPAHGTRLKVQLHLRAEAGPHLHPSTHLPQRDEQ